LSKNHKKLAFWKILEICKNFQNLYKLNLKLASLMSEQNIRPSKTKRFIKETIRVLRITKKPNKEEFQSILKITGLGVAIIGAIGFIIFLIKQILFS